jgi:predicted nuclease of predicted toxin-antitoxin system
MWAFLIDEDMPRSLAALLRQAGHTVEDVRDVGLRGQSDAVVFAHAQATRATLITADKGLANMGLFPPGTHAGIIVSRIPDTLPTSVVNQEIVNALTHLAGETLTGLLVIIEPGRIRVRRPDASP